MMNTRIPGLLVLGAALALAACGGTPDSGGMAAAAGGWVYPTLGREKPLVIGHRGASGALPEHTLEAYQRALNDGADCIEPDLVFTKDGVLVSRHDTYLSTTTDVAAKPEFASRKRRSPDPEFQNREDWWVADFTLAELKTLRAVQPFRGRTKVFDGLYQIPTFDEVLELAKSRLTVAGKAVCVYPEAKSPAYHAQIGHADMAEKILAGLEKHGLAAKGSPVFIQSFEPDFVQKINGMTDLSIVMLVADRDSYDAVMAKPGAPFWDGLGPNFSLLMDGEGKSTGIVEASHAKGIPVHPWTFRDDVPVRGEAPEATVRRYLALGIDGFFTDFPMTGYKVRNAVQFAAD